jgi:hypothetical protein
MDTKSLQHIILALRGCDFPHAETLALLVLNAAMNAAIQPDSAFSELVDIMRADFPPAVMLAVDKAVSAHQTIHICERMRRKRD